MKKKKPLIDLNKQLLKKLSTYYKEHSGEDKKAKITLSMKQENFKM